MSCIVFNSRIEKLRNKNLKLYSCFLLNNILNIDFLIHVNNIEIILYLTLQVIIHILITNILFYFIHVENINTLQYN